MDYEGIKTLLDRAQRRFPRLRHLWMDAGYRGEDKGADWVQKTLGWSVDVVERPRQAAPKEVLMAWAREWAKEGVKVVDLRRFRGLFQTENSARKGEQCHEQTRPTHRSFAEKLSGWSEPPMRIIPSPGSPGTSVSPMAPLGTG